MKTAKFIVAFFFMLGTLASCSEEPIYTPESIIQEAPHGLELDKGEKWVVDKGMVVSIESMEKSIADFSGSELNDFRILGTTIDLKLSDLISNCTMKGQSHDELHKWLMQIFDLNDSLNESNNLDEVKKALVDLEYELAVFRAYFK